MKKKILFKEVQSFKNTWLFYIILGMSLLSIGIAIILIFRNEGASEAIAGLAISILIVGGVVSFLLFSKLYTVIDEIAIYYRYPPFVNSEKKLTRQDIGDCYIRKYKPIWEYGGWGYRIRPGKGRALSVSGNQGLQIMLLNGKGLLIGTKEPEKMKYAIKRLKENWGMENG